MEIIIIAAIGKDNELGKNNNLIWSLKKDLLFFKNNTYGYPIIMGYNTYISLNKKLENREYIVLTHKEKKFFPTEIKVFNNINELLIYIKKYEKVFVIGGASIYKQFIKYTDRLLLTQIDAIDKDADAFFPDFDKKNYEIKILDEKEENKIKYKHIEYRRK